MQFAMVAQSGSLVLWIILAVIAVIALLALAFLARVLLVMRQLRKHSQAGRAASARVASDGNPVTTFNHEGKAGDPINTQITSTNGQLGAGFSAAGWYRADEIDFVTSARISIDSVLGRKYATAPVSNLYLYGRKEDYAFERPGKNVRERDHIRFWNTGRADTDGRPIWVGSATRDVKVELSHTNHLPTHGISPDLDAERGLVVSELAQTGYVIGGATRPGFGVETHGVNGGGDPYFTDGMVALLTLADVWTHPLATQVRGPLGASIAAAFERMLRSRLPKTGRERARQEFARLKQGVDARVELSSDQTRQRLS